MFLLGRGGGCDLWAGQPCFAGLNVGCKRTPDVPGSRAVTLAAQSEPSDDGPVSRVVLLDQIGKKATTLADELEEAATRMVVLGEATEMVGQAPDPLGQERDLDLRRPGVTFLGGIPGHDLLLLFPRERHSFLRTRTSIVTCSSMTGEGYQGPTGRANG